MRAPAVAKTNVTKEHINSLQWLREGWLQRIIILLTGLFILQYFIWIHKENMWLPGTYALALYTLAIVALTELFTVLPRYTRYIIQLFAIVLMHIGLMDVQLIPLKLKELFWQDLFYNISLYFPELAVSLAVWVMYLFGLWWVKKKYRIYLLLLISVLAIAIRDSFSLLILWDQAATMLICGIALIATRHFSDLKAKDPRSWSYLSEYPSIVAFPVVLLIAVSTVAGLSAPNLPPLVVDPYTAWMQWKGEQVPFTGKGRSTLLPLFSMDSASGYSRSDRQLGGGFNYDFTPVMTVDTSQASYWRGEVLTTYTGRGWAENISFQSDVTAVRQYGESLPNSPSYDTSKLETVEVEHSFTMLNDQIYPVIFGAYTMDKLLGINYSQDSTELPLPNLLAWNERTSVLDWNTRMRMYPVQYTVVSHIPIIDVAGLRQAQLPDTSSSTRWSDVLKLPDTLPDRVQNLAVEITQHETNLYDKVKAIEQYLSTTYAYNNRPDTSLGHSHDFVDQFLFEIQEGYCDHFSTAMVVLTRSIGIPARWVKGFTTGVLPYEELDMIELNPTGEGAYTVRNADAHSWVEVYFEGYGWIPFEPTAGFALPTPYVDDFIATPAITPDSQTMVAPEETLGGGGILKTSTIIVISLIVLGGLWLLWKFYFVNWTLRGRIDSMNVNDRIVYEFNRFIKYIRRKGYIHNDHETAREALQRWGSSGKLENGDLLQLLTYFEKAKYGKNMMKEYDWTRTEEIISRLRAQTKS